MTQKQAMFSVSFWLIPDCAALALVQFPFWDYSFLPCRAHIRAGYDQLPYFRHVFLFYAGQIPAELTPVTAACQKVCVGLRTFGTKEFCLDITLLCGLTSIRNDEELLYRIRNISKSWMKSIRQLIFSHYMLNFDLCIRTVCVINKDKF